MFMIEARAISVIGSSSGYCDLMKGLFAEEPKMSLTSMVSGVMDNIYYTVVFGRRAVKRSIAMQVDHKNKANRIKVAKTGSELKRLRMGSKKSSFKKAVIRASIKPKIKMTKVSEQKKSGRVIMSPVFSTKEQEKLFAKCARESMSIDARLRW